jgi:hypothetical protein
MCHHLRRNLFKSNQQGTTSPNEAAWYLHLQQKSETSLPAVIAIMDESDRQINFNSLKKSAASLPTAIAIMDESDHQINFNSLKKSVTSLSAAIGGIGLSFRTKSKKWFRNIYILWLYPNSYQDEFDRRMALP